MPAIKEICGIAWIERHRGESRERGELRARPFPAVSDEVVNAERAGARRIRTHRRRIPGTKIKIAVALGWWLVAPGIKTLLLALRRSISCAMELCFGGKLAPKPGCVGGGFGVTHVHRPFLGKAHFAKHGVMQPDIALGPPEHGVLNIFLGSPGPA